MKRFLLIDPDPTAAQTLGLECLARGVGVVIAENVCQGVRALLNDTVSLIVVDAGSIRLTPREQLTLFDRVAPDVPVVAMAASVVPLETRVALELAGFRVLAR